MGEPVTGFSANLGFLWPDLAIPEAIHAAAQAGFDAVECHWPYATPPRQVRAALRETGLPLISLNTRRGEVEAGENGIAALPGRRAEARAACDEALAYADAVGAQAVHVMAGVAAGPDARAAFKDTLRYACAATERTILIEPLNRHDAPGYFLNTIAQAEQIITEIGAANLKLMFDCYHVARTEGDVLAKFQGAVPLVGHVQFASVPDRGRPDTGTLDYGALLPQLRRLGWTGPFGAEYRPNGPTDASLGWLPAFKNGCAD